MAEKIRIDKWLWSIRIFKTRSLAAKIIKSGKVRLADKILKPSSLIQVGDKIFVTKNSFNFEFEVVDLIEKRVGAPLAQKCYIDHTPEEELNKFNDFFVGKKGVEVREKGTGRPTKRERREIDGFKDYQMYDWDE